MSGAISALRAGVAEQLRQAGLNAVTTMEPDRAARWRSPVVAVGLKKLDCAPGGFQDYLGLRRDPETGREQEVYGREVEITLALDVFAPVDGGEGPCLETAETVIEELTCRGAAGLAALELEVGRTEFLEKTGLYRAQASCRCKAWLVAAADSGGEFVDFVVKGRVL